MATPQQDDRVEYSSKDLKPSTLLMQDLVRAHNTFLLLHGASLSSLLARGRRSRFTAQLTRYWDLFLATWNVSLHGNPARSIFGGINIAASGELGVGVGEEERGSGEREVLEGLVGRIDGLQDVVVSRFGAGDESGENGEWLATGRDPGHEDGLIFAGTGALSRRSLRDLTHWMEDMYTWGENAYGVIESATSTRTKKNFPRDAEEPSPKPGTPGPKGDEVDAKDDGGKPPEGVPGQDAPSPPEHTASPTPQTSATEDPDGKMDKFVNILKLGYGTYWSLGTSSPSESSTPPPEASKPARKLTKRQPGAEMAGNNAEDTAGNFLIGLKGAVEEYPPSDSSSNEPDPEVSRDDRTVLRAVHVELAAARLDSAPVADHASSKDQQPTDTPQPTTKLRVVVYANKPFLFVFLFNPDTRSLEDPTMYRSLHYQLAPLRKPLLQSTSYRPPKPDSGGPSVLDLVWDADSMGVHCAIPNIPDVPTATSWTRTEALGVHSHILNVHGATRSRPELERTAKTNRGWWIIWTRILARPPSAAAERQSALSPIREDDSAPSTPSSPSERCGSDDDDGGSSRMEDAAAGGTGRQGDLPREEGKRPRGRVEGV
jgi:hypothetical protein